MSIKGGAAAKRGGDKGDKGDGVKRGRTSNENPFKEIKENTSTMADKSKFEQAFADCVTVCARTEYNGKDELAKFKPDKLEELGKEISTGKARHSDKVWAIGGYSVLVQNMDDIASKCKCAADRYKKLMAESIWTLSTVSEAFDPAELRSIVRTAETLAKAGGPRMCLFFVFVVV
jgi:hypothetical protein